MFLKLPQSKEDRWIWALYAAALLAYGLGMFLDVMGVDATQYASISLEMLQTGNWLEVKHRGADYLDKPPMHFWLSALSFKLFGVSNFAYKLPSFLATILGVWSVIKLGNLLYYKPIGKWAGLMFFTTQAMFLVNQDVRTDTILVGLIAFSSFHLLKWGMHGGHLHWIMGFAGAGFAMLAKGPLGLMVPLIAVAGYMLVSQKWKLLLRWEWIAGLVVVTLVISPALYGLWLQWDSQPQKELYGMSNVSGIRFYLWDQSFGRLTGTNPFINQFKPNQGTDPSFFVHTSLWSLLPWSIACFAGWFLAIKKLFRHKFQKNLTQEGVIVAGITIPMLALTMSEYKLPHYIYVVFPFFLVAGAHWLHQNGSTFKWFRLTQWGLQVMVIALAVALILWAFTPIGAEWLIFVVAVASACYALFIQAKTNKILVGGALTAIALNILLNGVFYRQLSVYESGAQAGRWLKEQSEKEGTVYFWNGCSHALDFYGGAYLPVLSRLDDAVEGDLLFAYSNELPQVPEDWRMLAAFEHHTPTLLTLPFINPATRANHVVQLRVFRKW